MQQDRQHLFGGEQGAEDDDDEVAVDTFELPPPPANPQVCVLAATGAQVQSQPWQRDSLAWQSGRSCLLGNSYSRHDMITAPLSLFSSCLPFIHGRPPATARLQT